MARTRLGNILVDPNDAHSMAQAITQLIQIVDSQLSFGDPQDPRDDSSTDLAGDSGATIVHNGTLGNFDGSWVEVEFAATDTATTFNHNLNVPFVDSSTPNVRWLFTNFRHSGANTVGTVMEPLTLEFDDTVCATTVTADSIALVLREGAGSNRTIAAGDDAVKCCVFMIPALRWA